jgi:hypothetical protein
MADQHTQTTPSDRVPDAEQSKGNPLDQSLAAPTESTQDIPPSANWKDDPFAHQTTNEEAQTTEQIKVNPLDQSMAAPTESTQDIPPYAKWQYDPSARQIKNEAAREFAVPNDVHVADQTTSQNHTTQEVAHAAPALAGNISPPQQPSSTTVAAGAEGEGPDNSQKDHHSNNQVHSEETPSPNSSEVTLENFHKEMKWERHGYRPVSYFRTVEEARNSGADTSRVEAYVSVKHAGFTTQELAALPDNAKQSNYYIGFAKQLLDSSEGIFTKKFWTSFDGIKKVFSAGIIKGEVEEIRLEAAEWLMGKRVAAAGTPAVIPDPVASQTPAPESPSPSPNVVPKERVLETKTLDTSALQEIDKRIQEKLETLRGRIIPETITVRIDDPKSAQLVRQLQRYGEGFNSGLTGQINKVHEALDTIGKLGLDQPQQGIVFKKKQQQALNMIDSLSFEQGDLEKLAKDIKVPRGNKLPESMQEAMRDSTDILEGIKSDLEEARRLVASARRINPAAHAEKDTTAQRSNEPNVDVKTGSVATMPRLGKELTIDPQKLEAMGHAMVDANIRDKDLNTWYKMVMTEFVKSYVGTFSDIRKEIYQSRMDGSNLNEMQKHKFRFLADELGQEVKVSDLVQLDYSKFSLPFTEELDSRFRRVIDGSKFHKALNQMKTEFAAALTKEIDKVPGTENTDTTYVTFKRQRIEKSGITDYLAKN